MGPKQLRTQHMNKWLLLGIAFALSACNGQITAFVKGADPLTATPTPAPTPVVSSGGPILLKVSPGQMKASAAGAAVEGNVTATNRLLKSGNMSAKLSISTSRSGL